MTISDKLTLLANNKAAIKAALASKGISLAGTDFSGYADKISKKMAGSSTWVRPADWLALPNLTASDNKFVGLYAIFPTENYVAVVVKGDCTINWGDGTVENFASGATAQHSYDYNNAALNGTLSTLGYKQAIVTITPQAGQTLTSVGLAYRHSAQSASSVVGWLDIAVSGSDLTYFLVGSSGTTSGGTAARVALLERVNVVNSNISDFGYMFHNCTSLRSVVNLNGKFTYKVFTTSTNASVSGTTVTSVGHGLANGDPVMMLPATLPSAFYVQNATADTFQLASTPNGTAATLTNYTSFYAGPALNFTFNNCYSLTDLPDTLSLSNVISLLGTFTNCKSLLNFPHSDMSRCISFRETFNGCLRLASLPATMDVGNGQYFTSTFANCTSLQYIPDLNTVKGTRFDQMFNGCSSLIKAPNFNTSLASGPFTSIFQNCSALTEIPSMNTSAVTQWTNAFSGCENLKKITGITVSSTAITIGGMFSNCYSLQSIPAMDLSGVTAASGVTGAFTGCGNLTSIILNGLRYSVSISNCRLSATALDALYTSLGTASGQTITVTGNYGISGDNPAIATAKGWTVTGS